MKTSRKFSRIGTAALGLAALVGSGCALNRPYIGEREREEIISRMNEMDLEGFKEMYNKIISTPYEDLATKEAKDWVENEMSKSLNEKDFRLVTSLYFKNKGKKIINPSSLNTREKLELATLYNNYCEGMVISSYLGSL
ncbi:MAG: hypothetical protein AABX30_00140 [Nanoarchaeota archaeon]